ncbi:MAG: 4-(cytidine 5'-diphospho)-2-C-methyl-D-erythritol kinase [Bifidobacteriaceae bacterium]|jgi:4-diphosphocytidyl-2-C-methyl-D-erythritol kinase|nr:4-(cytidine 5'-diphospho)-2-C-methyl-D-erythritol kinase [Bifidobacteriaceae bacterium]
MATEVETVTAVAPAKINLALRVGPRRDDGYHPLNSLFHAVDLLERVTVEATSCTGNGDLDGGIGLSGLPGSRADSETGDRRDQLEVSGLQAAAVPVDSTNLALRAAALLRDRYGPFPPVRLRIAKAIPVAGGLAGGSADAAAALMALNTWWKLGLTRAELAKLGAELGSDVPFAIHGGSALGRGRGEDLSPAGSSGSLEWVLVTSAQGLSTPAVFARFDAINGASGCSSPPPIPPALLTGLAAGEPAVIGANLVNDLQRPAFSLRPELAATIDAALDAGACGAILSGSGPTVACLASSADAAKALAGRLASRVAPGCEPGGILRATGPAYPGLPVRGDPAPAGRPPQPRPPLSPR